MFDKGIFLDDDLNRTSLNLVGWVAEDLEELDWSSSYRLAVRADGHVDL